MPDDIIGNFSHVNDAFYVAIATESNEQIVGFCGLRTNTEDYSVGNIVNGTVIPSFRGLGIYKELFRIRESEALKKGFKTFLAITSQQNLRMKEFLIRDGFRLYTPTNNVPGFFHLRKSMD